jgi:transcriptional regulator with XRE-family HTH domain
VRFVESHLSKGLAFQIRSLREREEWSQQKLADQIGSNQNSIYRAENPNYGKQTLSTLRKIAAAFDVGLVVRFVPFSELLDWTTSTPRIIKGLSTESLAPENFSAEEKAEVFNNAAPQIDLNAANAAALVADEDTGFIERKPVKEEVAYQTAEIRQSWDWHTTSERCVPSGIVSSETTMNIVSIDRLRQLIQSRNNTYTVRQVPPTVAQPLAG